MHIPVLMEEVIENLNIENKNIIVDATLGSGGHAKRILEEMQEGILIAIDYDEKSIKDSQEKLESIAKKNNNKIIFVHDNFAHLKNILNELKIEKVDAIFVDLGWRIEQLNTIGFKSKDKLDMRLNNTGTIPSSAYELINYGKEPELARIFQILGQEKKSKFAAKIICDYRKNRKIQSNQELAKLLEDSLKKNYKKGKIHPATKIFQALRIFINKEIENLEVFMNDAVTLLTSQGRLVIIAYHSLEDKKVKNFLKVNTRGCICPREFPVCVCGKKPKIKIINKKAVKPSLEEIFQNTKSRSAKMRVAQKI